MNKTSYFFLSLFFLMPFISHVEANSDFAPEGKAHSLHVIALEELDSDIQCMHAIVIGRVQGVGFRDTVNRIALELHLSGTVKNLSDGTVEIWAEGPKDELNSLLQRLFIEESSGPWGKAKVDAIHTFFSKAKNSFAGFQSLK